MQKVLFQQRYGLGRPGALGSTLAVAGATGGTSGAGGGADLLLVPHIDLQLAVALGESLMNCSLKVPLPPMVPTLPQSAPPSNGAHSPSKCPSLPCGAHTQSDPKKNNCQFLARGTLVVQAQCIPM